jgi:hypothetical protein
MNWLAILASLLDGEGLEIDDRPPPLTLTDLHTLANTDNLLDLIAHLQQGRWNKLWKWVKKNAYAWGYSSSGSKE